MMMASNMTAVISGLAFTNDRKTTSYTLKIMVKVLLVKVLSIFFPKVGDIYPNIAQLAPAKIICQMLGKLH